MSPGPDPAPLPLPPRLAACLRDGFALGRGTYGDLGLAERDYLDAAATRMARIAAQHGAVDDAGLLAAASRAALGDLYLATACDLGRAGAWEVMVRTFEPRLIGLARHRGLRPAAAEGLARELLGELALAPAHGTGRTRIGAFLGAGSLFGWLALILVRRLGAAARARTPLSLVAADDEAVRDTRGRRTSADAAEPIAIASAREDVRRVHDALAHAWETLSPRERIALVWRHVDGVTQQEIARRLSLGGPRASRILGGAVERLRGAAEEALGEGGLPAADDPFWTGLEGAVAQRLALEGANRPAPPWAGRRGPTKGRGVE